MLSISPLSSLTPAFYSTTSMSSKLLFCTESLVTSMLLLNPMDSLHTSDLISHFLPLMMLYSFFFKLKLFYMYLIGRWLQYCNVFAIPQHELATEYMCTPHPEPHSTSLSLPHPSGLSQSTGIGALLHALNLQWSSILHRVTYIVQCLSFFDLCVPCFSGHSKALSF